MITQKTIAKCFQMKLVEKELKQKDIAESTGIPVKRVSRILNLKSKMLADEMLKICFALGIDPNDFKQTA